MSRTRRPLRRRRGAQPDLDLRHQLTSLILDDPSRFTRDDLAEQSGLPASAVERLWRAMGFADPGDEPVYGQGDVAIVAIVSDIIDRGLLDEATVLRLTRALGQTMAKLADWQVAIIAEQVEADVADGRATSRLASAVEVARDVEPGFERIMQHIWKRHLAAAAARVEALGASDATLLSTTMTVGFADLSRFTAMTNEIAPGELGDLVEEFETRATDVITDHGGRMIKALGDAVLYVNADPRAAVTTAHEIVRAVSGKDGLPSIRVGLATGSVLSRLGDVFGPPVNMAARLSHVARSHRVLVDADTAVHLSPQEFDMRTLSPRLLRGFGEVSPVTVSRRRTFRASR